MKGLLKIMARGLVHCLRETDVGTSGRVEEIQNQECYDTQSEILMS